MNKIRVIDLLNKIANGEEVPKKIKYMDIIWEYDNTSKDYIYEDMFLLYRMNNFGLNNTIEIIEEKKIPEKIKDKYCSQISKVELAQKYNEIIDYLDYLKSKGE